MTDDMKRKTQEEPASKPKADSEAGEEYAFLTEKTKRKPLDKKKIAERVLAVFGLGLVAGAGLCLTFYALRPVISSHFPEKQAKVTIPKDEEEEEQNPEEEGAGEEEPVERELTIEDFSDLYGKLRDVYRAANLSMVEVTGFKDDVDWFNMEYEDTGQASGVIIANSGREYLILTERRAVDEAKSITVTFCNDEQVQASLKMYDGNTGFAVVGVPLGEVGKNTRNYIKVITLGNSNLAKQGDPVIALGNPSGYHGSMSYGFISAVGNVVSTEDAGYELLTTDIPWNENSSGALVNLDGELVGIISQKYCSEVSSSVTNYFGISDLKPLIEMLSNGETIPYVGIKAEVVTNKISEDLDVPRGIYVTTVSPDSPAMKAGIQNNDVITEVDGSRIYNVDEFNSKLMGHAPKDVMRVKGQRKGPNGYTDVEFNVTVGVLK